MNERQPTVLCVEDSPSVQAAISRTLEAPAESLQDANGRLSFRVTCAGTAQEAERLLRAAHESFRPYDVVLLDLGLPATEHCAPSADEGKRLLSLISENLTSACNAVVVQTAFTELPHLRDVIREDAADFVAKPFEDYEVFSAVVSAYKKSRERLAHHWYELQRRQRQQWIVAHACSKVADDIISIVSDRIGTVQSRTEQVVRVIEEQFCFDFDRDPEESICKEVTELSAATRCVTEACMEMRPQLHLQHCELERICLEDLVKCVFARVAPGLGLKRINLEFVAQTKHHVDSFRDEVESIVQEVVFSAVEASPDGSTLQISVQKNEDDHFVDLRVTDHGISLNNANLEAVRLNWRSSAHNERIWMLSLVQRLANSIGARLSVNGGLDSNTIVLQLMGVDG